MQLSDTSDIHALTAQLGLTLNESEVYFFLLKRGLTSGTDIYTQMNMDKSSCYRALNSLQQKRLVYKIGEERNQQFGANPIDRLNQMIASKKSSLEQMEKQLNEFSDTFQDYAANQYLNKNVAVLEGIEGYKFMLEDRLTCKSKLVRDISTREVAEPFFSKYDEFMKNYIQRRADKKVHLHQLTSSDGVDNMWERSSKKMYKEVRTLSPNFSTDAVFGTWDDKTSLYSKEKGTIIGIIIKDTLITKLMNSMYDVIWSQAE